MIEYLADGEYKYEKGGRVIDSSVPRFGTKFALLKARLPKLIEEFNIKYNEFIENIKSNIVAEIDEYNEVGSP